MSKFIVIGNAGRQQWIWPLRAAELKYGSEVLMADKPRKKNWTVLVYMVADDPDETELLDQEASRELDQIIFGGLATNHLQRHVAIQVDFRKLPLVWRRVVGEGTWDLPELDSTDFRTLHGFISWAMKTCPAERYMLVFWGHAVGPFGIFREGDDKAFIAQTLTLPELRGVLTSTKKTLGWPIDIVLFKDCFMGTLEVAYELKDLARFLITSQSLVPIRGWPYQDILGRVGHTADVEATAMSIVGDLGRYYAVPNNRGKRKDVPFSMIDLSQAATLAAPLKQLTASIVEHLDTNNDATQLQRAIDAAAPADKALLDIMALSRHLQGLDGNFANHAARELELALTNVVPAHTSRRARDGTRRFSGLSLFHFPFNREAQNASKLTGPGLLQQRTYERLALCADTGWDDVALRAMPGAPVRPIKSAKQKSSFDPRVINLEVGMPDEDKAGSFVININLADVLKLLDKQNATKKSRAKGTRKSTAKRRKRTKS